MKNNLKIRHSFESAFLAHVYGLAIFVSKESFRSLSFQLLSYTSAFTIPGGGRQVLPLNRDAVTDKATGADAAAGPRSAASSWVQATGKYLPHYSMPSSSVQAQ